MITSMLLTLFAATTTTCDPTPVDRAAVLLEQDGMACYGVAADRRSLPIRENYIALSPAVDRLRRGQVFIGQRVAAENKVLVYSPEVEGAVGIARHTFTRRVSSAYCLAEKTLYMPNARNIKGWGRALDGDMPLPTAPGRNYSAACYQHKKSKAVFWANRPISESNQYERRILRLSEDGEETTEYPLWSVRRIAISQCEVTN